MFALFAGGGSSGEGLVAARGRSLARPRLTRACGLAVRGFLALRGGGGGSPWEEGEGLAALLKPRALRVLLAALLTPLAGEADILEEWLIAGLGLAVLRTCVTSRTP